jgi:hypothetical protein
LNDEQDEFVLRVAMHTSTEGAARLAGSAPDLLTDW